MAKSKVIFFGNERLATGLTAVAPVTLRALVSAGYEVSAVASRPTEGMKVPEGIPLLHPGSKDELLAMLEPHEASIGVLVAFGMMMPQVVIDRFEHGIINLHPSLLPVYRGATPIEQTILDGVTTSGVSLMGLSPAMDAGPVFAREEVALTGTETKPELAERMQRIGAELLVAGLPGILDGSVRGVAQDDAQATYTHRITKADGALDWRKPAAQLEREVRAFAGWPSSHMEYRGTSVTVTAAHVDERPPELASEPGYVQADSRHSMAVLCGDDKLLVLERVKPAGKREMSSADFVRGLR